MTFKWHLFVGAHEKYEKYTKLEECCINEVLSNSENWLKYYISHSDIRGCMNTLKKVD